MEDWDLQAVVRGCRSAMAVSAPTTTAAVAAEDPLAWFSASLLEEEDDHLLFFPDLLAAQTSMQELEELCKPFYPKTPQPKSPQIHSSMVPVSPSCLKGQQQQQQQQKNQRPASSHPQISRSKRRKSQQKKVVCEVPAEGLSSDMWAWRKYGQKPIKGSPYPRSYYRCSSLKGCSARKQVERSRTDPSMFIITYTGEHSHPLPTHRNSLAGSTRHKHSNSSSSDQNNKASVSSDLSPMEEDPFLQQQQEQEQLKKQVEEGEEGEEEVEKDELMTKMADDLFLDLEELQEPTSSNSCSFSDCFSDPFPWVSSHSATSAASDVR